METLRKKKLKFYNRIGVFCSELKTPKIKADFYSKPEDFIVEELHSKFKCTVEKNNLTPVIKYNKKYIHATLVKKNLSTFECCEIIARENQIPLKEISFCGLKDTFGLTAQRICIRNIRPLTKTLFPNFFLKDFSDSDQKLSLRNHLGNSFKIKIKNISVPTKECVEYLKKIKEKSKNGFPNFYGPQRFGKNQNLHQIGKLIVKRKFKEAYSKFLINSKISKGKMINKQTQNDFIEILRTEKSFIFAINSYSSYLWNLALSKWLSKNKNIKNIKIFKIGSNIKPREIERKFYLPILKKEGVKFSDFNFPIKEFNIKTHLRNILFYPRNFQFKCEKNFLLLTFDLGAGEYTSLFLDFIFDNRKGIKLE
ncbi:MAG: tRNA pseudouridine(13) synthase TruD [Patescibacteria group bacterium]